MNILSRPERTPHLTLFRRNGRTGEISPPFRNLHLGQIFLDSIVLDPETHFRGVRGECVRERMCVCVCPVNNIQATDMVVRTYGCTISS